MAQLPSVPPNPEDETQGGPEDQTPALPPQPTDLFTKLTPTMDAARGVLADLGLRPYRTYRLIEEFEGEIGDGAVTRRVWDEIVPTPRVTILSAAYVAASGGRYLDGAVRLSLISRARRREELVGRTLFGDPLPKKQRFLYALVARGQVFAELYKVAGEPTLLPLSWTLTLNPVNRRIPGRDIDQ